MEYQLVELGTDIADYFPGFGAGDTDFTHVILGQGTSIEEAYGDLLDQLYDQECFAFVESLGLPMQAPFMGYELSDEEIENGWQVYIGLRYYGGSQ